MPRPETPQGRLGGFLEEAVARLSPTIAHQRRQAWHVQDANGLELLIAFSPGGLVCCL